MDNRTFQLRPSVIALVFQLVIFILFMFVLYHLLPTVLWGISFIVGLLGYIFFRKSIQPLYLEHLDQQEWSLGYTDHSFQRVEISHIIDHQLYVVIYCQGAAMKPLLIWFDQLSLKQWKVLKILAKMV